MLPTHVPPPLPPSPPKLIPHNAITIDGDANFSAKALLEGWSGDGSPGNPYVIEGLVFDLAGGNGHCLSINNTQVSFIIRTCNFTGANLTTSHGDFCEIQYIGAGIYLENVTNGVLVNNTCNNNIHGIYLCYSNFNTVANNTCTSNTEHDINLHESDSNTVANNTSGVIFIAKSDHNTVANNICSNKSGGINLVYSHRNAVSDNICISKEIGIELYWSDSNTVVNNMCNSNVEYGIELRGSNSNTVANNTCNSNGRSGIYIEESDLNNVAGNTCNNNRIGIHLFYSDFNYVYSNTCLFNTEHDILEEPYPENYCLILL
jgi:parallel beta-helix repeat protein